MKAVIFDFDGTLADTIPLMLACVNELGKPLGLHTIHLTDELRDRSIAHFALHELKLPLIKIHHIKKLVERKMMEHVDDIQLFPGIKELIPRLKQLGLLVGVLTSNAGSVVQRILGREELAFDFVESGSSLLGKHHRLKRILRQQGLRPDEACYVGDEIRDVHACKRAKIPILAVTWGFNTQKALEREEPEHIVDDPREIYTVVRSAVQNASKDSTRLPRRASGSRPSSKGT